MATKKIRAQVLAAALAEEPPFHAGVPRLGKPHASYGRGLVADEFGIIRPADTDAVTTADQLRLPVLRDAEQKEEAPRPLGEAPEEVVDMASDESPTESPTEET